MTKTKKVVAKRAVKVKTEKILLRVLDYIKPTPERLVMNHWGVFYGPEYTCQISDDYNHKSEAVPPCRTTACLAGTVLLVTKAGREFLKSQIPSLSCNVGVRYFPCETEDMAEKILGITNGQAGKLFYVRNGAGSSWPDKHHQRYIKARNAKEKFAALSARVKDFIKTGK